MIQNKQIEPSLPRSPQKDLGSVVEKSAISKPAIDKEALTFMKFVFSSSSNWNPSEASNENADIQEKNDDSSAIDMAVGGKDAFSSRTINVNDFTRMLTTRLDGLSGPNQSQFRFVIDFPRWGRVAVKINEYPTHWHFGFTAQTEAVRKKISSSQENIKERLKSELNKEVEIDVL